MVLVAFTDKREIGESVLLVGFVAHLLKLILVKCHVVHFRPLDYIF